MKQLLMIALFMIGAYTMNAQTGTRTFVNETNCDVTVDIYCFEVPCTHPPSAYGFLSSITIPANSGPITLPSSYFCNCSFNPSPGGPYCEFGYDIYYSNQCVIPGRTPKIIESDPSGLGCFYNWFVSIEYCDACGGTAYYGVDSTDGFVHIRP